MPTTQPLPPHIDRFLSMLGVVEAVVRRAEPAFEPLAHLPGLDADGEPEF